MIRLDISMLHIIMPFVSHLSHLAPVIPVTEVASLLASASPELAPRNRIHLALDRPLVSSGKALEGRAALIFLFIGLGCMSEEGMTAREIYRGL